MSSAGPILEISSPQKRVAIFDAKLSNEIKTMFQWFFRTLKEDKEMVYQHFDHLFFSSLTSILLDT